MPKKFEISILEILSFEINISYPKDAILHGGRNKHKELGRSENEMLGLFLGGDFGPLGNTVLMVAKHFSILSEDLYE